MDSPTQIENQTPKEKPVVISSENNKKTTFKFSFVNPKILAAMTVMVLMITGIGAGVYLVQKPQQTVSQANFTPVDVIFKPSELETPEGVEFSLDVYATSNNNQITSANLVIEFPLSLTLKSITPGQYLPRILIPPAISQGAASVSLGTDGTSGVSGSGVIATLVFISNEGSAGNLSQIKFGSATKISVLNRTGEDQLDNLGSAEVTITTQAESPAPSSSDSASLKPSPSTILESSASATSSPSPSPGSYTTDFNNDGLTNSIDLSVMFSGWGTPQTDIQKKADLNSDGKINGIDYATFLPNFKL